MLVGTRPAVGGIRNLRGGVVFWEGLRQGMRRVIWGVPFGEGESYGENDGGEKLPVNPQNHRPQCVWQHEKPNVGRFAAEDRPKYQLWIVSTTTTARTRNPTTYRPRDSSGPRTIGIAAAIAKEMYTIFMPMTGTKLASPVRAPASAG